jgi:hypothetical protein
METRWEAARSAIPERVEKFARGRAAEAAAPRQVLDHPPERAPPTGYFSGIRSVMRDRANSGEALSTMMGLPSWYCGAAFT